MALVLANRVQETATPNTTVSFTLTGAVSGFQTFAVIGNTNTTYYTATDTAGNWEVGLGQYSTTGPTLTRLTFYASSAGGGPVSFPGNVTVFVTYPSGSSVYLDFSGNVSPLGTIFSGNWQASTVGVAYGGTGVTTSSGPNSVVLRDANENITVNRINQGLQTVTATGGTTTLTAASDFNQALVGTGGHTFRLPDATTLSDTTTFQFNNNATGTLTIENNAGTAVGTVASGGAAGIALLSNATVGGTWDVHAYIPENVTWGTNALALGGTVISGGTWQGGTIQSGYGGTGLTTFTGANNALYSTSASALTAGTLPVAAGGTGLTSFTANGIPYANSTTTLTTGSALTFDGTTLANINSDGTGFSTQSAASNFSIMRLGTDSVNGYAFFQSGKSGTGTTLPFAWRQDSSDLMRLTSTGLGIGTISPAYKLDVVGTAAISGGVTLSGGTANGVAYLNGSKVLTTGSALVTDGSSLGLGGTPLCRLDASGTIRSTSTGNPASGVGAELSWDGTSGYAIAFNRTAGTWQPMTVGGSYLAYLANGSEQMRLTSTGLGIGTSSPWSQLTVGSGGTANPASTVTFHKSTASEYRLKLTSSLFNSDGAWLGLGFGYSDNYMKAAIIAEAKDANARANLHFVLQADANSTNASLSDSKMVLTYSGNLGIGTTSPTFGAGSGLEIERAGVATLRLENSTAGNNFELYSDSLANGINLRGYNNAPMVFWTNNTERMRLDSSGNLGIGTSSPNYSLTSYKGGAVANYLQVASGATGAGSANGLLVGVDASGNSVINAQGAINLYTYVAGVLRTTIDSSGNLGLGVTPSASWDVTNSARALQFTGGALYSYSTTQMNYLQNAYYNGSNFIYLNTAAASAYRQISGAHSWYTAASGTAGNAISFTQAMTLDASGNLALTKIALNSDSPFYTGANISSGSNALGMGSTGAAQIGFFTNNTERARIDSSGNFLVGGTSSAFTSSGRGVVQINGSTESLLGFSQGGTASAYLYSAPSALLIVNAQNTPITFSTNSTERARIDSSGNLLVGTTSTAAITAFSGAAIGQAIQSVTPVLALVDSDDTTNFVTWLANSGGVGYLYTKGAYPLVLGTGGYERARIDSSGDLLVGTTSQPVSGVTARLAISQSAADYSSVLVSSQTTAANCYGARIQYTGAAPNGTGNPFLVMLDTGGDRAVFRSNGGLANYSANDVNLSDRREKTNFAPAKSYLDTICAIPVQTFNYIDQSEDDPGLTLGVVAQDVQAVAPELVMESNWGTKEDPKMRLSIYQTDLQYALMKCIQELKAEVDSLKAQLKGTQP